jgi:hypothetical protein
MVYKCLGCAILTSGGNEMKMRMRTRNYDRVIIGGVHEAGRMAHELGYPLRDEACVIDTGIGEVSGYIFANGDSENPSTITFMMLDAASEAEALGIADEVTEAW